jgi:nicotinamidase-related amidase
MCTFPDRNREALLVIDFQNGVVIDSYNLAEVTANIKAAVAKARARNVPVIWVQHSDEELIYGSDNWQIVETLAPSPTEPLVHKKYRSSFEETPLEETLASLGVSHLYICGAQTNNCVRHTTHAALERGYDITLIADAHTCTGYEWNGHTISGEQVVNEQNDNFYSEELPGRNARALATEAIFN